MGPETGFSSINSQVSVNGQQNTLQSSITQSAIKFRNDRYVLSGLGAYPYKVYKDKNGGFEVQWEQKIGITSLEYQLNITNENSDGGYMDLLYIGKTFWKKMKDE